MFPYGVATPRVLSPFRGGGIAYLSDPDSYTGWNIVPFGTTVLEKKFFI